MLLVYSMQASPLQLLYVTECSTKLISQITIINLEIFLLFYNTYAGPIFYQQCLTIDSKVMRYEYYFSIKMDRSISRSVVCNVVQNDPNRNDWILHFITIPKLLNKSRRVSHRFQIPFEGMV